jgi:hypothetical protein
MGAEHVFPRVRVRKRPLYFAALLARRLALRFSPRITGRMAMSGRMAMCQYFRIFERMHQWQPATEVSLPGAVPGDRTDQLRNRESA